MAKRRNKRTPSRIRYEHEHPTVCFRVSRETYERSQVVKEAEGKSFADIWKVGLGILEVHVKQETEVRKQGYDAGYRKGLADADSLYRVTYPCSVCGKTLTVTSKEEKAAIKRYMKENRWGHKACHEKNG